MAITYQVRSCKNPCGTAGTDYASCQAVKTGDYDFNDLANDIAEITAITPAEVRGVVAAYVMEVKRALINGNTIEMDKLGTIKPGIKGHCFAQSAIVADDFNPSEYIDGFRVRFIPNSSMLRYVRMYGKTKRVSSSLMD